MRGSVSCGNPGADVLVGDIYEIQGYGIIGDSAGYSIGTISCNIGDQDLAWFSTTDQHPVIAQNIFRLKTLTNSTARFEQIGQSWVKHGFAAEIADLCNCGCNGHDGSVLGVGCSDPYSSFLNGWQVRMGPKHEVNPHTGIFAYPFQGTGLNGNATYKRIKVAISDIDPNQNGGGSLFAEAQYITPDDAAAGNQNNNASYRPITIALQGLQWRPDLAGATVRGDPAIRAWHAADPTVLETDIQIPGDGLVLLAAKATDLGDGTWNYEYAIQNLNADRAIRAVTIPVGPSTAVSNIGFHDISYHSGEPFDAADWPGQLVAGALTWTTFNYCQNANANALRWGTIYNFRFDANLPPTTGDITLTLFKPGDPTKLAVSTIRPAAAPLDCNGNSIDDIIDLAAASLDRNANNIPDECESFTMPWLDGDLNISGLTDARDVQAFADAMLQNPSAPALLCHGDFSANGLIDPDDVPGFVSALLNP